MFQNMGINVSPDAIRYLVNRNAAPAEVVKAAAQSGKSVDEVNAKVNDTLNLRSVRRTHYICI